MIKAQYISTIVIVLILAASTPTAAQTEDEIAVQEKVEQFLKAFGSGDVDSIPALFADHANVRSTSFRNGSWEGR